MVSFSRTLVPRVLTPSALEGHYMHVLHIHTCRQNTCTHQKQYKQTNETTDNKQMWEKENPQLTAGGTVNSSANLEICWRMFKKLKINLHYGPVIPLLSTCPKDLTFFSTDTCSFIFTAAIVTTASKWQQSKYPSSDEWIIKCFSYRQWNTIQL